MKTSVLLLEELTVIVKKDASGLRKEGTMWGGTYHLSQGNRSCSA